MPGVRFRIAGSLKCIQKHQVPNRRENDRPFAGPSLLQSNGRRHPCGIGKLPAIVSSRLTLRRHCKEESCVVTSRFSLRRYPVAPVVHSVCRELQAFAEQHPSKGHLVRIQRAAIGSEALPDVFSFKRQNPAL